jgi:methylated-DNA-[protein]-cysteine S-methyltransferase
MGQRPANGQKGRPNSRTALAPRREPVQVAIFATQLGWFGLAGTQATKATGKTVSGKKVVALTMGHASPDEVRSELAQRLRSTTGDDRFDESDWHPELRRALEQYSQGRLVDLRGFQVDLSRSTPFRKRVLEAARRIPYGKTATYSDLAARAGNPRAARAVGSAMATNPISILIPCHRVVASGGAIGGFSCRTGVELKQRLLELEASGNVGKSHGVRIR